MQLKLCIKLLVVRLFWLYDMTLQMQTNALMCDRMVQSAKTNGYDGIKM